MQAIATMIKQPILIGLLLSVAAHGWFLRSRLVAVATTPTPLMETGRTVVQLTLLPSRATPKPIEPEEIPTPQDTTIEPTMGSAPSPLLEEIPIPEPEPLETEALPQTVAAPEPLQVAEVQPGVVSYAVATSTFRPAYPRVSRQRGEEGVVVLSVRVLASGRVGAVQVLQSSGYRRLDDAAIDAARQTRFNPAQSQGTAIDSTTELSFTFRLADD